MLDVTMQLPRHRHNSRHTLHDDYATAYILYLLGAKCQQMFKYR